jgi:outer membrane protein assembly factor BamB
MKARALAPSYFACAALIGSQCLVFGQAARNAAVEQALIEKKAADAAAVSEWLHWRGPTYTGAAAEQPAPEKFGKDEGVAWTAPMHGGSASTPVVTSDRVFVSSADPRSRALYAAGLDRSTGRELWRHKVADGDRRDERSDYASPSPVSDGKRVWFFYGQGELVSYSKDGEELWRRNIQDDHGPFAFQWTPASSPLLHDGRLYIQVLQRNVPVNGRGRSDGPNDSYLLAIDPDTGKDLWRHVRPSEARAESLEAFTSPVPFEHEGKTEILISGGDCISGHNPANGSEYWRWGTWNPQRITHWRLVPSPVAGGGMVLACAPKGGAVYAIKAGQSGTLPDDGYTWMSEDRDVSTDVSTPLFYRGRFFVLNSDKRILSCVEPASGKVLWKGDIPGRAKIEASPTAADGKIYVMNFSGDVFVLGAGDKFEVLHTAPMGGPEDRSSRASIPIADGQLFIRTATTLYAVGGKS